MGRGKGGTIMVHVGTNNAERRGNGDCGQAQELTEEDEGS